MLIHSQLAFLITKRRNFNLKSLLLFFQMMSSCVCLCTAQFQVNHPNGLNTNSISLSPTQSGLKRQVVLTLCTKGQDKILM